MDAAALRYTTDHEWIGFESDIAVVGITDYAQKHLGDITYVDLPAAGKNLEQHAVLGFVESVKAASDIYAPAAGAVSAVNEALQTKPELINQDPYGQGWICKLRGVDRGAVDKLMTAEQYAAHCAS